jgi:ribokinase
MSLVVLGSINADLYVEIDRLPAAGETIAGTNAAVRPGGKGANQAAAAARQGCPTRFIGRLGSDPFAGPLRAELAASGCDTGLLATVDGPTGQAFILLQRGGENSIVIVAGANHAWSGLDAGSLAAIRSARCLLLQREVPEAVNLAAAEAAHAAGVPVVLDAGGAEGPLPAALLRLLTVLSPNETELARLTDLPTGTDDEVLTAARQLQAQGVGTVLVKLGARGSLLVPPAGPPLRQGIFPVAVVDTTGAGDCFTASYTVGLVEGLPETVRLRRAAAAAAICVQGKGAMPSMPSRAAVDALAR